MPKVPKIAASLRSVIISNLWQTKFNWLIQSHIFLFSINKIESPDVDLNFRQFRHFTTLGISIVWHGKIPESNAGTLARKHLW